MPAPGSHHRLQQFVTPASFPWLKKEGRRSTTDVIERRPGIILK